MLSQNYERQCFFLLVFIFSHDIEVGTIMKCNSNLEHLYGIKINNEIISKIILNYNRKFEIDTCGLYHPVLFENFIFYQLFGLVVYSTDSRIRESSVIQYPFYPSTQRVQQFFFFFEVLLTFQCRGSNQQCT